ncbi:histidine--tRNA ligase [bacterium]|nr:histidine--tRNA ligase [bacterium]NBX78593.1 histidine--tRNA ligase [bacterium]
MFTRVKGTQDWLDCLLAQGVLKKVEGFLKIHNFSYIMTPLLEYVQLFERGLGYETDVVSKQMFLIDSKNEDEKICLRPEATAGVVRAFLEQQHAITLPWNAYTFGPMFRYERPQKGRYRQFHQVNLESIGVVGIEYDALFITMLQNMFLQVLQVTDFVLKINYLGTLQDREVYKKTLQAFLQKHESEICATCIQRSTTNILRCLDCKVESCQAVYKDAPVLTDSLSPESAAQFAQLQKLLLALGVTFVHDPFLVRGLDYYNNTVFEFVGTALGAQNAFCGGGRYDSLAIQLGAKQEIPAIGAGIGFERLLMLCEEKAQLLQEQKPQLTVIIPVEESEKIVATILTQYLTQHEVCTQLLAQQTSLKSRLKTADKLGARYVIIIGSQEREQNYVTVKHMVTGKESQVVQADLVQFLKNL